MIAGFLLQLPPSLAADFFSTIVGRALRLPFPDRQLERLPYKSNGAI
jgi:hypothetical protein